MVMGPVIYVTQMSPKHHHMFVYDSINHVLNTSPVARKLMGDMLHDLVKYKVVAIDNFLSGLFEALQFAEDMAIDIHKIWQYYGELMSPVIQEDSVPISLLSEPTTGSSKAGLMLVKVLQDVQRETLYRKTRSILNKLTPQMFQKLVSQMQSLPIDTEDRLKGVIDLVFEKAISEPNFSVAYANMCRCLSMCKVPSETKPGEMVRFRAILLTQCQREFEKDKSSKQLFLEKRGEIEKAEESKKEELRQILQFEEAKAKRRYLGNIRFIGELFKLKMMTENIMHDCVFILLRTKDPDNLECLCTLLTTIGRQLDTDKAKPRMDQYFNQMRKISNEKKTPFTVRFLLQDVMDLRANKWIPRHTNDNVPKTIDQIHKEAQQEAQEKAMMTQQNIVQQNAKTGTAGGRRVPPDVMRSGVGTERGNIDGSRTGLQSVNRPIDPSKMKFAKQNVAIDINQLCAAAGLTSRFVGWGRGSTAASNRTTGSSQSVNGSCRDSSRGRQEEEPTTPASAVVKELTSEEMEKKTKAIMDEYLYVQDIEEAVECVKELSPLNHHQLVYNSINHVLERSVTARKQTGHLLHDLIKDKHISVDSYLKGLLEVLETAEDMEIAIPNIWKYYAELISPMVQDGSIPLCFLKDACQPLIANNKAGVLLAKILHDASQREGHKKIARLWLESGLRWSEFVPKNEVDQFLIDQKLEFSTCDDSIPVTPTTDLSFTAISEKLHELIVVNKADNEEVIDWIETNVDEPTTKQPKFIRALMSAVCYSAVQGDKGKERVEPKDLKSRYDLLRKYLDHQHNSELQGLYALQALVTNLGHPPGVLRTMFDTLYDEDIISEDVFIHWEKSADEPAGKGAALKQVVQFFRWLEEAEEDC